MKKPILYFALISVFVFIYCNNTANKRSEDANVLMSIQIKKAKWLLGKWQNISADGLMQEIWIRKNDSTFIGSSFFIVGNDTVSSENISLEERGKDLFYIPIVKNQNDGKPIIFTLTSLNDNQLVFENPSHDFPQKITYTQVTIDSLVATISGIVKGNEKTQSFPMARAK